MTITSPSAFSAPASPRVSLLGRKLQAEKALRAGPVSSRMTTLKMISACDTELDLL